MNRLSMTLGLALCTAIAVPALAAPPAPPAKPVIPAFEQKELIHPVLIHKVIDGLMVAGQKLPPEGIKGISNLFPHIETADKISGNVIFKDRLYRAYPVSQDAEKQLSKLTGQEVKIRVKQIAPGRFVFVSLEP